MIYLKAPDEETFKQAVIDAGWTKEVFNHEADGMITVIEHYTSTHSLDEIGTIHVGTGNMIQVSETPDYPGSEYEELAPIDGWHANLLLHGEDMPSELAPFVIEAPSTPHRTFA